jgi:3-phenylpropionate/cinnamic acid dioxygenase small subunit
MYKTLFCLCLLIPVISFASQNGIDACKNTIQSYPQFRDNGPVPDYLNLFTNDALFTVKKLGIVSKGKKQIEQRLIKALKTDTTIHVMGNISLQRHAADIYKAESDFSLTLIKRLDKKARKIFITGTYSDELIFDGAKCLIKSRNVIIKTKA